MKITKVQNKLGIGAKIEIKYLEGNITEIAYVKVNDYSYSKRLALTNSMYMDKDLTIPGMDYIHAKCKVIPFKRFKFRYKR